MKSNVESWQALNPIHVHPRKYIHFHYSFYFHLEKRPAHFSPFQLIHDHWPVLNAALFTWSSILRHISHVLHIFNQWLILGKNPLVLYCSNLALFVEFHLFLPSSGSGYWHLEEWFGVILIWMWQRSRKSARGSWERVKRWLSCFHLWVSRRIRRWVTVWWSLCMRQ